MADETYAIFSASNISFHVVCIQKSNRINHDIIPSLMLLKFREPMILTPQTGIPSLWDWWLGINMRKKNLPLGWPNSTYIVKKHSESNFTQFTQLFQRLTSQFTRTASRSQPGPISLSLILLLLHHNFRTPWCSHLILVSHPWSSDNLASTYTRRIYLCNGLEAPMSSPSTLRATSLDLYSIIKFI